MRNQALIQNARRLRKGSTREEHLLWRSLREPPFLVFGFRRQHPIERFIVDFASIRARLIIEVDGGQHADSSRDAERDSILMARNWSVLRLWNHEVRENLPGVLEKILDACQSRHDI